MARVFLLEGSRNSKNGFHGPKIGLLCNLPGPWIGAALTGVPQGTTVVLNTFVTSVLSNTLVMGAPQSANIGQGVVITTPSMRARLKA